MFDFDIMDMRVSKCKFSIILNKLFIDGKEVKHYQLTLGGVSINKIIKEYLSNMRRFNTGKLKTRTVEQLIDDAIFIRESQDMILALKGTVCNADRKPYTDLSSEVRGIVCRMFDKFPYKGLKLKDKLLLSDAADKEYAVPCEWELEKFYCPVKDCDKKIKTMHKLVKSIKNHGRVSEEFNKNCIKMLRHIKAFREMKTLAGDDIVNWGQHKVSRWCNENYNNTLKSKSWSESESKSVNSYTLLQYAQKVSETLISKGIKPKKKKERVDGTRVLVNRFNQGNIEDFTQKNFVSVLKKISKDNKNSLVPHFDIETCFELIDQKESTKVMQEIFGYSGIWGKLITRISELCETDKQFQQMIKCLEGSKRENLSSITFECLVKFSKIVSNKLFIGWLDDVRGSGVLEIPTEFFDSHVKILDKPFSHHDNIGDEFLKRMSEKELIEFLKNAEQYNYFTDETFHKFYLDIDYSKIKDILCGHEDKSIMYLMYPLAIKNSDKKFATNILLRGPDIDNEIALALFDLLDKNEKIFIYTELSESRGGRNPKRYCDLINTVFVKSDIIDLYKELLKVNDQDYYPTIFEIFKDDKDNSSTLIEITMKNEIRYFTVTQGYLPLILKRKDFREYLLGQSVDFNYRESSYSYFGSQREKSQDDFYEKFFKDFSRKELENLWGIKDFTMAPHRIHLIDYMSFQEKEEIADGDIKFFKRHIENIGYHYCRRHIPLFDKDAALERGRFFCEGHTGRGGNPSWTTEAKSFKNRVAEVLNKGSNSVRFIFDDE